MCRRRGQLLWVDGLGGLAAGGAVLSMSAWLSVLDGLPRALIVFMGGANLAYGAYSTSLAALRVRPAWRVAILAVANLLWAVFCLVLALRFRGEITPFGLVHVLGEGLYVGGLGCLEWWWRDALRTP